MVELRKFMAARKVLNEALIFDITQNEIMPALTDDYSLDNLANDTNKLMSDISAAELVHVQSIKNLGKVKKQINTLVLKLNDITKIPTGTQRGLFASLFNINHNSQQQADEFITDIKATIKAINAVKKPIKENIDLIDNPTSCLNILNLKHYQSAISRVARDTRASATAPQRFHLILEHINIFLTSQQLNEQQHKINRKNLTSLSDYLLEIENIVIPTYIQRLLILKKSWMPHEDIKGFDEQFMSQFDLQKNG